MTFKSLKGILALLLCLFASVSFGQTSKRPNILIIMP